MIQIVQFYSVVQFFPLDAVCGMGLILIRERVINFEGILGTGYLLFYDIVLVYVFFFFLLENKSQILVQLLMICPLYCTNNNSNSFQMHIV